MCASRATPRAAPRTFLEARSLDTALVAGEPAYEALMGIGRRRTDLKILAAMYSGDVRGPRR
jgi:hypothetical protein